MFVFITDGVELAHKNGPGNIFYTDPDLGLGPQLRSIPPNREVYHVFLCPTIFGTSISWYFFFIKYNISF